MPSLNVAWVLRIRSFSSSPRRECQVRMCGMVASPTPTVPISSDSTSRMRTPFRSAFARPAAVIHPAVPPPTMTTDSMGPSDMEESPFLHECALAWHSLRRLMYGRAHSAQPLTSEVRVHELRARIDALRPQVLTDEHREPARLSERLLVVQDDASPAREQVDLALERRRQALLAELTPERALIARAQAVMQDHEIPNALVLGSREAVVFVRCGRDE